MNKINVGYATVAKKVDVKRLKRDLWVELEQLLSSKKNENAILDDDSAASLVKDEDLVDRSNDENLPEKQTMKSLSFQSVVSDMQKSQAQGDVTLPFYFICMLHLCNEKGLALESRGLDDFRILGNADAIPEILSQQ